MALQGSQQEEGDLEVCLDPVGVAGKPVEEHSPPGSRGHRLVAAREGQAGQNRMAPWEHLYLVIRRNLLAVDGKDAGACLCEGRGLPPGLDDDDFLRGQRLAEVHPMGAEA